MPKRITATARKKLPKPKTLAQQNLDFTSEGSPAPGRVAAEPPVSVPDTPAHVSSAPSS